VGIGGGWEERTGFPDPDTIPQTAAVLSVFTLPDVVRHWQLYFPVLADASYVSDAQAVWVVVTVDVDVVVDDAIAALTCGHWQVDIPVLAGASYVSVAQAVWVVVTIDVNIVVDDAIAVLICGRSRDVVMVKIWVLVQTPPKEEVVVVRIEGGLEILRG
jgi:hypothetical protein